MSKENIEKKSLNNAHNKQIAISSSWLNDLFQYSNLSADEKCIILRNLSKILIKENFPMDKEIKKEKKAMDKGMEKLAHMDKKNDKKHESIGMKKAMKKKGCR